MTALEKPGSIAIDDDLADEQSSATRPEYLGGTVNRSGIPTNAIGSWFAQLRGKPCRPFNRDLQATIDLPKIESQLALADLDQDITFTS